MSSAAAQGLLWSTHARDWADIQQSTILPAASTILHKMGPWENRTLLDIGCGAGIVAGLADDLGAVVSGIDAAADLVEIARSRIPSGTFLVGDMANLPFHDGAFNAVTAFNCLHFCASPRQALAEALRVTAPGGTLAVAFWEDAADSDALIYLVEIGGLLPPEANATAGFTDSGRVEEMLADLEGDVSTGTIRCTWYYPDLDTALRGLLSTGPAVQAIRYSGRKAVTAAVTEAIKPCLSTDGSYLLNAACRYYVVTVPRGATDSRRQPTRTDRQGREGIPPSYPSDRCGAAGSSGKG